MKEMLLTNCAAKVVVSIDTSSEKTRSNIEKNSLQLHCKKIDKIVGLRVTHMFGALINATCQNWECPFYVKGSPS